MATFNLSPSVDFTETDLTLSAKVVGNVKGAMVMKATWGEGNTPVFISNGEDDVLKKFGTPESGEYVDYHVAKDFLSYTSAMHIIRPLGAGALNATSNGTGLLVENDDDYDDKYDAGAFSNIEYVGKYAGDILNGAKLDIVDSTGFASWQWKDLFEYTPESGEYSAVLIDASGKLTGTSGEVKQKELVSFSIDSAGITSSSGVRQVEELTVLQTGSIVYDGGAPQEETYTILSVPTSDDTVTFQNYTIDGLTTDTVEQVAIKFGEVMETSGDFKTVTVTGAEIKVVWGNNSNHGAVDPNTTDNGVEISETLDVAGYSTLSITVDGVDVICSVEAPQNASTVDYFAADIRDALIASGKYNSVTTTSNVVTVTRKDFGAVTPISDLATSGITVTGETTTTGVTTTTCSVGDVSINVTIDTVDPKVAIAAAAQVYLTNNIPAGWESVTLTSNNSLEIIKSAYQSSDIISDASENGINSIVSLRRAGSAGIAVERFELLSSTATAKHDNGSSAYFVDVFGTSKYINVGDVSIALAVGTHTFGGGVNDNANVDKTSSIELLSNAEKIDGLFLIGGDISNAEQKLIADQAITRRDVFAFISPQLSDVLNNSGDEVDDIIEWREVEVNKNMSYLINSDNWGLVPNNFTGKPIWIPTCGGVAGLMARMGEESEVFYSPAFYNRGRMKNYIRLAWNANKKQRDELYKRGINSVISERGQGVILYGDKTSLSRPSAFDRINVRTTFIILEKSMVDVSKYFLGEFNDEFTRGAFINAILPLLRNLKSRRAFKDFRFVADERNNTADVIQGNEMIGSCFIKPLYSINYIKLNFYATPESISFEEVENAVFGD